VAYSTGSFSGQYDLYISANNPNAAATADGTVTYAINGTSMTSAEPNSCQTATLTEQ